MTIWDDRILEFINEEGAGSPKKLEDSGYVRISNSQISRRMRKLAEEGYLTNLGNAVYVITDKGEEYLKGEWDAETDEPVSTLNGDNENGNGNGVAGSGSQS